MKYNVHISNIHRSIAVNSDETLLLTALEADIDYPHGCREGRCGSCKSRVVSGSFSLLDHSRFALSVAEKEDGMILACRARPQEDSEVRWIGADDRVARPPMRKLALTVEAIERVTPDVCILRLSGATLDFLPGQYARLTMGDAPPRDYSMANQPGEAIFEFHIRQITGGATSAYVHNSLKVGDPVGLEGPFGTSHLHETHLGPILCIAGGTGAAPVLSIVEGASKRGMRQPIHVYHGGRTNQDLYVKDRLAVLAGPNPNLSLFSIADENAAGVVRGRVIATARDNLPGLSDWKCYFAGPVAMTEAATELALGLGAAPSNIHIDPFFTPSDA